MKQPCVIKPQGTGCGHGIEFFFGDESDDEIAVKVDAALTAVGKNYLLECQGLPYTICQFLDTVSHSLISCHLPLILVIIGCVSS